MADDTRAKLHELIATEVFVQNKDEQIYLSDNPDAWLFDFRRVLMKGAVVQILTDIFLEEFAGKYPFQIGTMEIAGVPLMAGLVTAMHDRGYKDINGFFIRKSRKKTGLLRMIEGEVLPDVPIILVDDIMNSGNSFWRQVEALEELNHRVDTVWSILRFRNQDAYTRFHNRCISVQSIFDLNDFTAVLGEHVKNIDRAKEERPVLPMPFRPVWAFVGPNPSLSWVNPKSQPLIDGDKIYFGADDERFRALNQSDGSLTWGYKVGHHILRKSIFSSPAIYKNSVIFGSYDGNVYALGRKTGECLWRFLEADWVGSSPAVAEDLGLVFIGLEFGVIRQRGGIAALDAKTGKRVWVDYSHPAYTHSSPLYIKKHRQVVIGSNDGKVRLYDAKSGTKLWEFTTFGGASYDPESNSGFGEGDIKGRCAYDPKRDWIIAGSIDGFLYIIDRKTGHLVFHFKCGGGIWSSPYVWKDKVYFTSVDKHVRCLDLKDFSLVFEINLDGTRIFSTPTIIKERLYIGTNAARLHELNPLTGERLGYFQATERITNSVVYNPATDRYFLPTYANQIICLERKEK